MAENKKEAENIFRKSENDMSEMELMMANIIQNNENEATSEEKNIEEQLEKLALFPPETKERVKKEPETALPDRMPVNASARADFNETSKESAKVKKDDKKKSNPRATNIEREKKIAKTVKKSNRKPAAVILVLCAFMIIGALVFHAMMENIYGDRQENSADSEVEQIVYNPSETDNPAYYIEIPPDTVFPSPETEEEIEAALNGEEEEDTSISIISDPRNENQDGTYTLYVEDVSWTAAQEKCASMGGHLVTISNQEELDKVIAMAEEQGIEKLWIGCHRENGQLIWENYETIDFYKWGKGEPSEYDSGDNVAEDYVMLWKFNGEWVYNDSRNDPVADYPAMYSGKIAYICEDY